LKAFDPPMVVDPERRDGGGTEEGSKLFWWGDARGDCEDEGTSSRLRRTGMYPKPAGKQWQNKAPSLNTTPNKIVFQ
jgi:hypothetical protein